VKKCIVTAILTAAICAVPVLAQQNASPVEVIWNHYAARNFESGPVPKADLERIIQAGIRAPSANNRQPWYFTVVQDLNLAKRIIPQTAAGNVIIIISAAGDGKTNSREILDSALATESIYLAAQALGHASRIYTGPVDNVNKNLKSELDLPGGYSVVAMVRIGKAAAGTDAVSAASSRKAANTLVTYK
jgi:nitroreductase